MKAFKNSAGSIEFFKWDTDMSYWDGSTDGNTFSNVTYNTDGTVASITGPGGELFTSHDTFTKNVTYT